MWSDFPPTSGLKQNNKLPVILNLIGCPGTLKTMMQNYLGKIWETFHVQRCALWNIHIYRQKILINFVLLTFQIYFHNQTHPDGYLTRMGRGERPFVLSSGPSLFIRFETGEEPYSIPYIGFKASFEFVSGRLCH